MSRDSQELEQIRLALAEVRKSQERMDETSRSLREVSDLLERMLKAGEQTGPVDVSDAYVYESTTKRETRVSTYNPYNEDTEQFPPTS